MSAAKLKVRREASRQKSNLRYFENQQVIKTSKNNQFRAIQKAAEQAKLTSSFTNNQQQQEKRLSESSSWDVNRQRPFVGFCRYLSVGFVGF